MDERDTANDPPNFEDDLALFDLPPEMPSATVESAPIVESAREIIHPLEVKEEHEEQSARRRNPFADMGHVSSQDASTKRLELPTRGDLKKIKKANIRHGGQKVVTDDVKKLKSLEITPEIPAGDENNYYVEPVKIEYYIPRESRFSIETRYLYIPLIDPAKEDGYDLLRDYMQKGLFFDLLNIMNLFPQHITTILESYDQRMSMLEAVSLAVIEGDGGNIEQYRHAFYLTEALLDYEPTIASLEVFGAFQAWNLNWLIRRMNRLGIQFAASDKTVAYLIKLRNEYWEYHQLEYNERFEILAALFFEQAYPNRGISTDRDEDYFYDIFDQRKHKRSK